MGSTPTRGPRSREASDGNVCFDHAVVSAALGRISHLHRWSDLMPAETLIVRLSQSTPSGSRAGKSPNASAARIGTGAPLTSFCLAAALPHFRRQRVSCVVS